jgi:hypothetical protein
MNRYEPRSFSKPNMGRTDFQPNFNQDDKDTVSCKEEAWKPSEQTYIAFRKRDADLCNYNVRILLTNYKVPHSLRDLKEACLHNIETLEQQLTSLVASGQVLEEDGKFQINPNYKGRR